MGLLSYREILCHLTCVNIYFCVCVVMSYIDLVACVVCECDLPMVTWAAGRISVTWPGLAVCMEYPDPVKRLVKSRLLYCMT